MTRIISISLTEEDAKMIDDYELKPTGLFRQKLQEVRDNAYNFAQKTRIYEERIEIMRKRIEKQAMFIDEKKLLDEFNKWEEENGKA